MEWNDFSESNKEYPEKIVENTIDGFSKAAKNLVFMAIKPMSDLSMLQSKLNTDFGFTLNLGSQYLKSYSLNLLSLGYNVELRPINVTIEETIFEEIYERKKNYKEIISFDNESDFKKLLESMFQSKRFNEIVTGLMKIARKNAEEIDKSQSSY